MGFHPAAALVKRAGRPAPKLAFVFSRSKFQTDNARPMKVGRATPADHEAFTP